MIPEEFVTWARTFWWLRGAATALAILAIVPQITSIEEVQILRAAYVLIVSWNEIVGNLGSRLFSIFGLPAPEVHAINIFILFFSFTIPFLITAVVVLPRSGWSPLANPDSIFDKIFEVAVGIFTVFLFSVGPIGMYASVGDGQSTEVEGMFAFLVFTSIGLLFISLQFRSYVRGIVSVIVFFVVLNTLYALNTPFLPQLVDDLLCWAQPLESCMDLDEEA